LALPGASAEVADKATNREPTQNKRVYMCLDRIAGPSFHGLVAFSSSLSFPAPYDIIHETIT
jgi:hypothetical protein